MTRSSQLTHALSAIRTGRAGTVTRSEPAPMRFLVSEDNPDDYRWSLVLSSGERLAQSPRLASYQEATRAARVARAGAGSAPIETDHAVVRPTDVLARRSTAADRYDLCLQHWPHGPASGATGGVAT